MAAAKEAMRDFANTSIRFNKKMDDAAKLALGVRPRNATPTARPRASQNRWWKTPAAILSISSGPWTPKPARPANPPAYGGRKARLRRKSGVKPKSAGKPATS
jgi:hypothetical protein